MEDYIMNLVEGQLLELKKDLNCGLRIIKAGTIFEVVSVGYNVALKVNGLGAGIFTKEETEEYFVEHKEEDKFSSLADEVAYIKAKILELTAKLEEY